MTLSDEDLKAIGTLMHDKIKEVFESRFTPFQHVVNERFDGLYKIGESHQQELLSIGHQLDRIQKTNQRHEQQFDDLVERVRVLETKTA